MPLAPAPRHYRPYNGRHRIRLSRYQGGYGAPFVTKDLL